MYSAPGSIGWPNNRTGLARIQKKGERRGKKRGKKVKEERGGAHLFFTRQVGDLFTFVTHQVFELDCNKKTSMPPPPTSVC